MLAQGRYLRAGVAGRCQVQAHFLHQHIRRRRSILANFLVPLHVMAEVGGLSMFIRHTAIAGDVARGIPRGRSSWSVSPVGPAL